MELRRFRFLFQLNSTTTITLEDPYRSFSMRTFNVGAMIRDHLKDVIEDFVDNGQNHCSCSNLDRLILLLYALDITYLPIDNDGDILCTAEPLILNRHTDLCSLFKAHAMNRSIADLKKTFVSRRNQLPTSTRIQFSS